MLVASNRRESAGFSSTLTLTTFSRPANSRDSSSRIGPTNRHGPHHGAHRSTTTATDDRASMSKVASVALTSHGSGLPHEPQCGAPRSLGLIVLRVPQFAQTRIDCGPAGLPDAAFVAPLEEGIRLHRDLPLPRAGVRSEVIDYAIEGATSTDGHLRKARFSDLSRFLDGCDPARRPGHGDPRRAREAHEPRSVRVVTGHVPGAS